jgi:hypothetical protein
MLGLMLGLVVHPADLQDREGAEPLRNFVVMLRGMTAVRS